MTLGENLARLRREHNVGQKELALRLNVSIGTISNYENGVHTPNPETLSKLADFFDVSVDYILGRTGFRYNIKRPEQRLSRDYTVTDIVNMMIDFDSNTVDNLMEYAQFLQAKRKKA